MQSLRNLARAAPRTISRLTTPTATLRSTMRPSSLLQTTLKSSSSSSSPFAHLAARTFSTTPSRLDDQAQELAAKLEQEMQFEASDAEAGSTSNDAVTDWLAKNETWTLIDNAGEQEVLLSRKYEDETITVAFSIADFDSPQAGMGMEGAEADEAFDDEDLVETAQSGGANSKDAGAVGRTSGGNVAVERQGEELYEDGQGEDEEAFPASVNVLIQRPSKGALRISLIADAGSLVVQSVTHLPDSKHTTSLSAAELLRSPTVAETAYTGPPFQQLDEGLQNLIENYLDVRGLNSELAVFIPEYIDVKEQREYVGWLGRLKGFVE